MTVSVTPLGEYFVAEIGGVDLTRPLSNDAFATIEQAFDDHSILIFHDQPLDDAAQIAFSQRFGPLETTIKSAAGRGSAIARITNTDENGNMLPAEHLQNRYNAGNEMWHTDSSFKAVPSTASLLSARVVPPAGGETEFATARAAYETLDADERADLDERVAIHDFSYSRGLLDPTLLSEEDKAEVPPVRQAMVRANPVNGRKALFLGAHASHIEGMEIAEGRARIQRLNARIVEPRFTYTHRWRDGDLVMWDNRCCLHRGRPFDLTRHKRIMHRTTLAGIGPTV